MGVKLWRNIYHTQGKYIKFSAVINAATIPFFKEKFTNTFYGMTLMLFLILLVCNSVGRIKTVNTTKSLLVIGLRGRKYVVCLCMEYCKL